LQWSERRRCTVSEPHTALLHTNRIVCMYQPVHHCYRVMSCLMEKLGTDHMTAACEVALLQIQYFVARDFKLDPQLYRECHDNAVQFCHAKK
jgi:hypothetical protein